MKINVVGKEYQLYNEEFKDPFVLIGENNGLIMCECSHLLLDSKICMICIKICCKKCDDKQKGECTGCKEATIENNKLSTKIKGLKCKCTQCDEEITIQDIEKHKDNHVRCKWCGISTSKSKASSHLNNCQQFQTIKLREDQLKLVREHKKSEAEIDRLKRENETLRSEREKMKEKIQQQSTETQDLISQIEKLRNEITPKDPSDNNNDTQYNTLVDFKKINSVLSKEELQSWKVSDLKKKILEKNLSLEGCFEKNDLINLLFNNQTSINDNNVKSKKNSNIVDKNKKTFKHKKEPISKKSQISSGDKVPTYNNFEKMAIEGFKMSRANGFASNIEKGREMIELSRKHSKLGEALSLIHEHNESDDHDECDCPHHVPPINSNSVRKSSKGPTLRDKSLEILLQIIKDDPQCSNEETSYALFLAGTGYLHKRNPPIKTAIEYIKKSGLVLNNIYALDYLGELYHVGRYVEKDEQKSVECFKKGSELGNLESSFQYALKFHNKGEYKTAIEMFEQLTKKKHFYAMYMLAVIYYDPPLHSGIQKNVPKTIEYLQMSIDTGNYDKALLFLGKIYEMGLNQNFFQKKEWCNEKLEKSRRTFDKSVR
eukprot:TRINITY_DN2888_c0_g1_i1.p1 TRINITY_DN2888_c0_g1~~TRINITY_DN2888_c0_g1_i1.p1  ORF type:complete len:601 (+),score=170.41 TRINITY_DN2888_c0_g1_i1:70-1872(+)